MVATDSLIRLAGVLCLAGLTTAGPVARARIIPKQVSASTTAGAAASTGFPVNSANSTASHGSPKPSTNSTSSKPTTTSYSFISTETDMAGHIIDCTALTTSKDDGGKALATDCYGPGVIASTNTVLLNSWNSGISTILSATAPSDGSCIVATSRDGSGNQYCTCGGGGSASASMESTRLAYSRGTLTTACNTVPTGYVEVPEINEENGAKEFWAMPPSDAVAGNCTTGEKIDSRCWEALDLDDYVDWWWGAFQHNCDDSTFAECFYIAMTPYAPYDCSTLHPNGHCVGTAPKWSDFSGKWNDVRNFYVAYTIWNINSFFGSYYQAISNAGSIASMNVGNIINIADPIKTQKTNVGLNDLFTVLSVGLAFIPGPEAQIGKALLTGAQQSVNVAKFLYPEGTAQQQQYEMQTLSGQLGDVLNKYQGNLNLTLPAMLNNVSDFRPFVKDGVFSGTTPDISSLQNQILTGLNTYLISQAYQANSVFISRALNTSARALSTNGTKLEWTPCSSDYDNFSTCDTFWYDSVDGTTYALTSGDSKNRNVNYNKDMQTWFSNYTSPELLFKGADLCAQASKAQQGTGPILDFSQPGNPSTNCMSNQKVCTWQMDPTTAGTSDGKAKTFPVFSACTNDYVIPGLQQGLCKSLNGDLSVPADLVVPRSYLGWGILNNKAYEDNNIVVCIDSV